MQQEIFSEKSFKSTCKSTHK
ncbi:unnamed protein product [Larinioides sclopetarius]|uniref:Uncharacterized protein n=1 Tax=Larinioides sclopetarius TaxID=280406 RepID=A0AAV2BRM9_9ARAC